MSIPTLVVTGPVGVGKTSAATEVSVVLEERGVRHALIDVDALTQTFPRPADDPFHSAMALRNLGVIWDQASTAGARNLVLPWVISDRTQLIGIEAAVPGASLTVVRLEADLPTLGSRLALREQGSQLEWHLERTQVLLAQAEDQPSPDLVVDTTGLSIREVAEVLLGAVAWDSRGR